MLEVEADPDEPLDPEDELRLHRLMKRLHEQVRGVRGDAPGGRTSDKDPERAHISIAGEFQI